MESARNYHQERVDALRDEFGDREGRTSIAISSIESRDGNEALGIHVTLWAGSQMDVANDLDKIGRSIHHDGYNIVWARENDDPSETELIPNDVYEWEGAINALLIEDGVPAEPTVQEAQQAASTGRQTH